jgi:hypothetical protein
MYVELVDGCNVLHFRTCGVLATLQSCGDDSFESDFCTSRKLYECNCMICILYGLQFWWLKKIVWAELSGLE